MNYGRIRAGTGPTVILRINLHVGKTFGRDGSNCNIREELERRQGPLTTREEFKKYGRIWAGVGLTVPLGINLHVGKKSHCATRKEFVKQGRSWVDVGPTVPPGMNLHVGK